MVGVCPKISVGFDRSEIVKNAKDKRRHRRPRQDGAVLMVMIIEAPVDTQLVAESVIRGCRE